jgi:hypothetical protein
MTDVELIQTTLTFQLKVRHGPSMGSLLIRRRIGQQLVMAAALAVIAVPAPNSRWCVLESPEDDAIDDRDLPEAAPQALQLLRRPRGRPRKQEHRLVLEAPLEPQQLGWFHHVRAVGPDALRHTLVGLLHTAPCKQLDGKRIELVDHLLSADTERFLSVAPFRRSY